MNARHLTVDHVRTKEIARIFSRIRINKETGCWLWVGSRVGGYGNLTWHSQTLIVHRFMYAWLVAPLPAGKAELDHLCRVRECCNPVHLELVTPKQNVLRGQGIAAKNSKKTQCKRGHLFSPENMVIKQGGRQCKTCLRKHSNDRYWAVIRPHRVRPDTIRQRPCK